MDIQHLKYSNELIKTQIRLVKEMNIINQELANQQESCNHIRVCLGWDGPYQYRDTSIFNCLLCWDIDPHNNYKTVDATDYKKIQYSHGEHRRYREGRLLDLHDLALSIIVENPSITEEELIEKLNNIIQSDIEKTNK